MYKIDRRGGGKGSRNRILGRTTVMVFPLINPKNKANVMTYLTSLAYPRVEDGRAQIFLKL